MGKGWFAILTFYFKGVGEGWFALPTFYFKGVGGGPISLLTFYFKGVGGGIGSHFQLFTLRGWGRTDITSNFLL